MSEIDMAARDGARPSRIRFVLPAYNEAASIRDLLLRIDETTAGRFAYSVLVVDDGSSDATAEIVEDAARTLPVQLLRNPRNLGLGATIRRGMHRASDDSGEGEVIVTMDADLTQDPSYVPSMIDAWRAGADVVIASRYRAGSAVSGLSRFRHLMTFGARGVLTVLMPIRGVRDYSSGFRLYDAALLRRAYAAIGDELVTQNGFACMVEIIGKLAGHATIAEVPFELHYDDKRGPSKMKVLPTVLSYFRVVYSVWRMRLTGRSAW